MSLFLPRHRLPWSMNEINRLYNEYEIKEFDIKTIAKLHGRSMNGILYKLTELSIITKDWSKARGYCDIEYYKYYEDDISYSKSVSRENKFFYNHE